MCDCECLKCDGVFAENELCEYCGRCLMCCKCDREALKAQDAEIARMARGWREYFLEKESDPTWIHPTIPARK